MKAFLVLMYFLGMFFGALLLVYLVMHGKTDEAAGGGLFVLALFMIGGGIALGSNGVFDV